MLPSANAQENKTEVMRFGFNAPREPALAPDAPPISYWNIDDIRKAHTEMAEKAAKLVKEAGSGSSLTLSVAARCVCKPCTFSTCSGVLSYVSRHVSVP